MPKKTEKGMTYTGVAVVFEDGRCGVWKGDPTAAKKMFREVFAHNDAVRVTLEIISENELEDIEPMF